MGNQTAVQALINRMLSYTGCFDGYPSMECSDEALISNAVKEHNEVSEVGFEYDAVVVMSYLASDYASTREQYDNCRSFILAYLDACWEANMCEGSNVVHAAIEEEKEREYESEHGLNV